MIVYSAKKILFVAINASGRYYRVYPDGDIEIDFYPDGPTRAYKLLDKGDKNYAELLDIASKLW